jgi:hypothetical protein
MNRMKAANTSNPFPHFISMGKLLDDAAERGGTMSAKLFRPEEVA